jgi:hypothetical protein
MELLNGNKMICWRSSVDWIWRELSSHVASATPVNNRASLVTVESPSAHYERVCRKGRETQTAEELFELAYDTEVS